jgi:hypothetical protein
MMQSQIKMVAILQEAIDIVNSDECYGLIVITETADGIRRRALTVEGSLATALNKMLLQITANPRLGDVTHADKRFENKEVKPS